MCTVDYMMAPPVELLYILVFLPIISILLFLLLLKHNRVKSIHGLLVLFYNISLQYVIIRCAGRLMSKNVSLHLTLDGL